MWRLLGYPGGLPPGKGGRTRDVRHEPDFTAEDIVIGSGGAAVPGTLLRPRDAAGPLPAVLYCHAHGNRHDIGRRELTEGRSALLNAYGPVLAANGFAVLCIDMPGFGSRQAEGSETALSKAALWQGGTLLGRMLADLSAALEYLAARADVDADSIATLGLSMGATHAYLLAALDERIAACAHLCAFANMRPLIESGAHDLHGPYMTVPGLLEACDLGDIAALVAPRPQLVCCGKADPLTPPEALDPATDTLRRAYDQSDAADRLEIVISEETGHTETAAMRTAVLRFLSQRLQNRQFRPD